MYETVPHCLQTSPANSLAQVHNKSSEDLLQKPKGFMLQNKTKSLCFCLKG